MTDYGPSSAARVYERLERVFEKGLARIEARIENLEAEVKTTREDLIRLEERLKVAQAAAQKVEDIEHRLDAVERNRALERGLVIGAGAGGGGLLGWLAQYFSGGPS